MDRPNGPKRSRAMLQIGDERSDCGPSRLKGKLAVVTSAGQRKQNEREKLVEAVIFFPVVEAPA